MGCEYLEQICAIITKCFFTPQLMLLAMISGALVFCRLAAQYVHPQLTLYDRCFGAYQTYRERRQQREEARGDTKSKEKSAAAAVDGDGGGGGE